MNGCRPLGRQPFCLLFGGSRVGTLLGGSRFVYCLGAAESAPSWAAAVLYFICANFTLNASSEFSEYCEIKCFGGLHVYFRISARKVSSASLLNLLQLVIWLEIVSFCPNSTQFFFDFLGFDAKSCPSAAGMVSCFEAASERPSRTTDFDL